MPVCLWWLNSCYPMLVELATLLVAGPERLSGAKLCRMVSTKCSTSTSTSKGEVLFLYKVCETGAEAAEGLEQQSSSKKVLAEDARAGIVCHFSIFSDPNDRALHSSLTHRAHTRNARLCFVSLVNSPFLVKLRHFSTYNMTDNTLRQDTARISWSQGIGEGYRQP